MRSLSLGFILMFGGWVLLSAIDEMQVAKDPNIEQVILRGKPTDAHKILDSYLGTWSCKVRTRSSPEEEFQFSMGTSEMKLVMGGRFLKQMFNGDWAGQIFEGEGLLGYDQIRQEYQLIWIDNFSTGLMSGTGSYDKGAKSLKFSGTYSSPFTGESARAFRSEWKVLNQKSTVYTTYEMGPSGKEFQAMEIVYSRAE